MPTPVQDARYALRLFSRSPGIAFTAILTISIGIGANTAIFSVADALLLRPLPYRQPDRLVLLSHGRKLNTVRQGPLSWLRFQWIDGHSRSFSGVAAFTSDAFTLTGSGAPEQFRGARVS